MPVCGTIDGKPASGCEAEIETEDLKNLKPERPVGFEKSLQLSTEGFITLTYKGPLSPATGELWTICGAALGCPGFFVTGNLLGMYREPSAVLSPTSRF